MSNPKISDNFSRYAHLYDKYADVQNKAADALADSLRDSNFSEILELGCGTGNYTLLLRQNFSNSRIKALDISRQMVNLAQDKLKNRNIEFMVADAEKTIADEDFDLITSNACFQWLKNLKASLGRYAKLLQQEGTICFSIFGPRTFCELNTALKSVLEQGRLVSDHFYDSARLKEMLKDNFNSVQINEVCYQESFVNLKGLLEKIKYSGIRGNGLGGKIYFSRGLLESLEQAYLDKFKEISVTYQVFFCRGQKR